MNIEQALKLLKVEYAHAQACSFVDKPTAYALYQVWKQVDRIEVERDASNNSSDS